MMDQGCKKILLVSPSPLIAKGLAAVLSERGEFDVAQVLPDLSRLSVALARSQDIDLVVIDPMALDYAGRGNVRQLLPEGGGMVALRTDLSDDEMYRQFDETLGLYDSPVSIVHKLRKAVSMHREPAGSDSSELSAREKEILVCVAKGMLNKEIADKLNLSVYTVITHRKNITRKTGIKTVAGLTVYALLNNLIEPNLAEK